MTTVWGLLAKSIINGETIEAAIDRLILAHNEDETSHLETGQSLQSHKASLIIDHVARSVVRDKLGFDRFSIDEHFSTIDSWSKIGTVILESLADVELATTAILNNYSCFFSFPGSETADQGTRYQNPSWETRVKIYSTTNQIAYIIQGDPLEPVGAGFKIVNNVLYAMYSDDLGAEVLTEIIGISVNVFHNYRLEILNETSVKWYVDDVLVKTFLGSMSYGSDMYIYYFIKTTTTAKKYMCVQSFHFDADYL